MKKLLSKVIVATVLASTIFSAAVPMAYAAETSEPTVTLNGDATNIPARYINGNLYFSVADFWKEVRYTPVENIKWYEDEQILTNGYIFLSIKDQNWYRRSDRTTRFSDPVIFENGIVWAQPSFLKDTNMNTTTYEKEQNALNFKQTYWEFPNGMHFDYYVPLIPLDDETGFPVFSKVEQVRKKGFDADRFHILSQELENGKTVYAYINKSDPHKFLLVTCVDDYVAYVLDNNGIFTYSDYGPRC